MQRVSTPARAEGSATRCRHVSRVNQPLALRTVERPDTWACEECMTTDQVRLCLVCGTCHCERHCSDHWQHGKECVLFLELNSFQHRVHCMACKQVVTNDHRSGTIASIRHRLRQVQTLTSDTGSDVAEPLKVGSAASIGDADDADDEDASSARGTPTPTGRRSAAAVGAGEDEGKGGPGPGRATEGDASASVSASDSESESDGGESLAAVGGAGDADAEETGRPALIRNISIPFIEPKAVRQRQKQDILLATDVSRRLMLLRRCFAAWKRYRRDPDESPPARYRPPPEPASPSGFAFGVAAMSKNDGSSAVQEGLAAPAPALAPAPAVASASAPAPRARKRRRTEVDALMRDDSDVACDLSGEAPRDAAEAELQRRAQRGHAADASEGEAFSEEDFVPPLKRVKSDAAAGEITRASAPRKAVSKLVPGRCGLRNLGNTCYMNSVLQALSNSPSFRTYFLEELAKRLEAGDAARLKTSAHLLHLLRVLWSGRRVIFTPDDLLADVWTSCAGFKGFQQQDAQEFALCFIQRLQQEEKRLVGDISQTFIARACEGKLEQTLRCLGCGAAKVTPDVLSCPVSLQLPPPAFVAARAPRLAANVDAGSRRTSARVAGANRSIYELLEYAFAREERLTGADQYQCDACKRRVDAVRSARITLPPQLLVLHIVRMSFNPVTFRGSKDETPVAFPLEGLQLDWLRGAATPPDEQPAVYDLISCVTHHGRSLGEGHFTSFGYNHVESVWFLFNDARVTVASAQEVERTQPYLLFYERRQAAGRVMGAIE